MDAIRGWLACWKFCMTVYAIPQFVLWYGEMIRWTKEDQALPTCTYSNLIMVYAEMMLGKRMNWTMMMAHSRSQIIRETIDIPSDVDWNRGLMYHAIMNGLPLQQNQTNVTGFYDYMGYKRTMLTRTTFSQKRQVALDNVTKV
jgi:hypothetical protein